MKQKWNYVPFEDAVEIWDIKRKPINNAERASRINGKSNNELYPYYGATGQVGFIDDYLTDGEYVLLGEDGAPFLNPIAQKAYIVTGKTWVNNHAHVLKSKYNNKFLCYYLNSINYKDYVSGTTRLKLTQAQMKRILIPVPSIEEQERIVAKIEELFSELDNAVETLNATKTQLEVYRQAVLSDMLCKNTTNSTLEECLISLQNGIAKRSGTYGTPVKVLRLSNITNDSVIADSEMRSINLTTTEQQKYLLDEEDGIFVRVNGSTNRVGRLILINKDKEYAYCDHLIRCKFDTGVVIPKFIKLCLDTQHSRNYMMNNLVSSAGQNTISQTTIRNLPLWIPDLIVQEQIIYEIESRLSVYESIEKTIINTLQQATTMRQSILQQAFEGRLL